MDTGETRAAAAGDVWLRPPRARRETPPLSRERIVAEAIALLDEEGLARLTMRRLAERLGTGSTTLYWHVKTKDDVIDLALDEVFGEVALPDPGDPSWRVDVTALILGWRAAMLRHPWSTAVLARPLMGPNVLTRTEFLHARLATAGFAGPELSALASALANYVIGSALMQATAEPADEEAARRAAERHLRERSDRYPTLAETGPPIGRDWDDAFALGLDCLLDGVQARAGRE
ncbi:TetR/AcrR family transcriptional regulator C-terminal domain-containing protein [Actinomadura craniellae]|uniref:TetR/AcrR family transcriptional regulator C-terminal domain-containing protein n=1 Tax=Actinomadura craniellae TaxID=2231787 RepID=UPI001F4567B0|nr:TetR/AcrR family transcriptional regulator C-terminal domain-containing protein [Actinomadura craniellae]